MVIIIIVKLHNCTQHTLESCKNKRLPDSKRKMCDKGSHWSKTRLKIECLNCEFVDLNTSHIRKCKNL